MCKQGFHTGFITKGRCHKKYKQEHHRPYKRHLCSPIFILKKRTIQHAACNEHDLTWLITTNRGCSKYITQIRHFWYSYSMKLKRSMKPVVVAEWRAHLLTVREVSRSNPGNLPLLQTWHVGNVTGCHAIYVLIQCTPLLVEKAGVPPDVTFRITACKQERVQARYPLWIWNPWGRNFFLWRWSQLS